MSESRGSSGAADAIGRALRSALSPGPRTPELDGERRWWTLGLILVAVAAMATRWGSVEIGPMSDDFMQHGMIAGLFPGRGYAPFDLYAFLRRGDLLVEHIEKGTAPWWSEPTLHGTVFRPLASVLLWLDHLLFPNQPRAWHIHSQLWFGAMIVSFGLCARRLLPRSVAILAVLLFACEAAFVSPLGWLANRCVLICATFGFAAIRVHLSWRAPDPSTPQWVKERGPMLEAGLIALCMCAGEYGLAIVAYVVAWEWLVGGPAKTSADSPARSSRTRARALLPALVPMFLYLAVHKLLGYGTFGADVYADPVHSPLGWLRWATTRMPKLITGAFWSLPAATIHVFRHPAATWWHDLTVPLNPGPMDYHRIHAWFGVAGTGLAALVLALARGGLHEQERRTLRALLVGGLVGLLPVTVAPAHSRLLVLVQLAACPLVAWIIIACARSLWARGLEARQNPRWARLRGLALLPAAAALLTLHVGYDLRWGSRYIMHLDAMQASNIAAFTRGNLLEQELEGRDVIMLAGTSQSVGLYGEYVLHANGQAVPRSWRALALTGDFAMFAFRPSADTLELSAINGAWMLTAGELFFRRDSERLHAGDVLEYPTLTVTILSDDDGHPTRVRFRFAEDLDDPRYLFVISTSEGIQTWPVPAVGGRSIVPLARLPVPDGSPILTPP